MNGFALTVGVIAFYRDVMLQRGWVFQDSMTQDIWYL